jgi:hypothetical protein
MFEVGEWVEICGRAVDDPYLFSLRTTACIDEVIQGEGMAQYYVTLDATMAPPRPARALPARFGPFPESRFRRPRGMR